MSKHKYELVGEFTSIYRRGKTWWLNAQYRKRQIRQSLRTKNKKEAQRRARAFEQKLLDGTHSGQRNIEPVSIQDVVDALIRNCESEERAPKTITKYRQVLKQMTELAEELNLDELTQIDLQFIDDYRHRRKQAGCKPKTIYTEVGIIRRLVLFAKLRRMIAFDPLEGLKLSEPKTPPQPCWTPEQVEQILANVAENYRSACTTLSETGMRVGELRWLTWDDVDFENNLIHIRPKEGWTTKTGNVRAVPMSEKAKEILQQQPRKCRWIFTAPPSHKYPQGDHQISERRLLQSLKRTLKRLELSGHVHTFRHSFISRAVARGVPEGVIRRWVGHMLQATLRLYTHIFDKQSHEAMKKLNSKPFSNNEEKLNHDSESEQT